MGKKREIQKCQHCDKGISAKATECLHCAGILTNADGKPRTQTPNHNRYGLSRYIPLNVKKRVREECGFGCVFCGGALYHYDHFAPPFENLTGDHTVSGIALLCEKHHGLKTRGAIKDEQVAVARLNPKSKQQGFLRDDEFFLPGSDSPQLLLGPGGTKGHMNEARVEINDTPVLWFDRNEDGSVGFLNAIFCYPDGSLLALIEQNELKVVPLEGFEIETAKSELIIDWQGNRLLHLDKLGLNRITMVTVDAQYGNHNFFFHGDKIIFGSGLEMTVTEQININAKITIQCACGCDKRLRELIRPFRN